MFPFLILFQEFKPPTNVCNFKRSRLRLIPLFVEAIFVVFAFEPDKPGDELLFSHMLLDIDNFG